MSLRIKVVAYTFVVVSNYAVVLKEVVWGGVNREGWYGLRMKNTGLGRVRHFSCGACKEM